MEEYQNKMNDGKKIAESKIFKGLMRKAEEYIKQPLRVKDLLNQAFLKASKKKDIGTIASDALENLQILIRLIKAAITGEYKGIPTRTIVGGIAVIIYFLTPIDFIPDFIPVLGLLDDASLLAWFITSIKAEMEHFQEWETKRALVRNSKIESRIQETDDTKDHSYDTPKYLNEPEGTYSGGGTYEALSPVKPEQEDSKENEDLDKGGVEQTSLKEQNSDSLRKPTEKNDAPIEDPTLKGLGKTTNLD